MTLAAVDVCEPVFKEVPPGPELALLLDAQECDRLDEYDVVEFARAARRLAGWAASLELGAVAELYARRRVEGKQVRAWDSTINESVTEEIAAALTLSGGAAAHLLVMAMQLTDTLPLTAQALRDGSIDADKAKVIADGLRGTEPEVAGEVERQVLPAAPAQTCAQLRYAVRKAIRDADPEGCAERCRLAEEARCVELWETDQGTADLAGRNLPGGAATAAWNRVNAIAAALKADGDDRTIDQLRADVFVALLRNERPGQVHPPAEPPGPGSPPPDGGGDAPGFPAAVSDQTSAGSSAASQDVEDGRAAAATMAGAVREQLTELSAGLRRDVDRRRGQAALIGEAVRRIKAATAELSSRWCMTLTHEGVVRHGADSYRVPVGMRRWLDARDQTCRFPGCRRPAARCDADHTEPHHKGGATCPCNLSLLCRRHHRLKQRPEWQLLQVWPGVLVWIAPTGHCYVIGPDPGG